MFQKILNKQSLLSNSKDDQDLEKQIGVNFKNKAILHTALVHKSYLNENTKEKESNERLEFLGDAILEFVVSAHLFDKFSQEDEGHLTALRSKLVNTQSLALSSRALGLEQGLYLSRGEEKGKGRESISLLANTFEAVIGAIFVDQGLSAASEFISKHILAKIPQIVKKSLKDPKSLLQEYVQASGLPAPVYKTLSSQGPDHAKFFTVEVFINRKPYSRGAGQSKQAAAQDAAGAALERWSKNKPAGM